jgi:hypothetical protein
VGARPQGVPAGPEQCLESLGDIVQRQDENLLPFGDSGIIELRKLYLDAVKAVQAGGDPPGTIRAEADNGIHVIPAWEYDVTEEQYKAGMAAETTVTR